MCAFPLREEEKALWASVMRGVSPLRANVSFSVSSCDGERGTASLVKKALTTIHSCPNTQTKNRPTKCGSVVYNNRFQQGKNTQNTQRKNTYKTSCESVYETMHEVMSQSDHQVYKKTELQVSRETTTAPHPTVHLLRSVRAVLKERKRSKGYGESACREVLSKPKNKIRFPLQWHGRVESKLDLHGLSVQEAFHQFMVFIDEAQQRGDRCIEIITGLGTGEEGGILRRELPHWLERVDIRHSVLEVVYAYNFYKGYRKGENNKRLNKGAIRILLRQKEKHRN